MSQRWYRQLSRTLVGEVRGDFTLDVPPELREGSFFTDASDKLGRDAKRAQR
jgi:hypothetical protein